MNLFKGELINTFASQIYSSHTNYLVLAIKFSVLKLQNINKKVFIVFVFLVSYVLHQYGEAGGHDI